MKEIERKYVAHYRKAFLEGPMEGNLDVQQGYLVAGEHVEVRLRRTHYHHPAKGIRWHLAVKLGNGYVRREYEYRVPAWVGRVLGRFVPNWLLKTRLNKEGWAVDVFRGPLAGLVLAEYEVETEDAQKPRTPVGLILDRDVTDARIYANKRLSRLSPEDARTLVADTRTRPMAWVS